MNIQKRLLLITSLARIILFLLGCQAANFDLEPQISAATLTPASPPPAPTETTPLTSEEKFEEKYGSKVVTLADLEGWVEADPAEERYDDGLCKMFWPQTPEATLVNCVTDSSPAYNIKTLRAYYADAAPLVDLKPLSKYDYEDDFIFYAYLDNNDAPKYTLILEKDGFIYTAALIIPRLSVGVGTKFEVALTERFNEKMDIFLNKIVGLNLAKASSPAPQSTHTPEPGLEATGAEDAIDPDFVQYRTSGLSADIGADFSVSYPADWQSSWFSDSGLTTFIISSNDPYETFWLQDTSGAMVMIFIKAYQGEDLLNMVDAPGLAEVIEEPALTTINGQEAAKVVLSSRGKFQIQQIIVHEKIALMAFAAAPLEKEAEFRPALEAILETIRLHP